MTAISINALLAAKKNAKTIGQSESNSSNDNGENIVVKRIYGNRIINSSNSTTTNTGRIFTSKKQ